MAWKTRGGGGAREERGSDHAEESGGESERSPSAGRMAEEEEGRRPGNRGCGETGKSGEQPVGEGSAAGGGKRKKRSDVALLVEG